jgi:hypothetical protein
MISENCAENTRKAGGEDDEALRLPPQAPVPCFGRQQMTGKKSLHAAPCATGGAADRRPARMGLIK